MTLSADQKNAVVRSMMSILESHRNDLLEENQKDLQAYDPTDRAMYDRLIVDDNKVNAMIASLKEVLQKPDPVGVVINEVDRPNGLVVSNRTTAFGTILIIYESRPDVTVEAAVLAFKAGNKILLKGGKEARNSNVALVSYWHEALAENGLDHSWIQLLDLSRVETQEFLKNSPVRLDLIVPREVKD